MLHTRAGLPESLETRRAISNSWTPSTPRDLTRYSQELESQNPSKPHLLYQTAAISHNRIEAQLAIPYSWAPRIP